MRVAPLVGCHVALLALYDLRSHPFLFLSVYGAGFAALVLAYRSARGLGATKLLLVAATLRLLLLPLPPSLSDDVYRYVWDGRVSLAGANPYAHEPAAEALAPLRNELWASVAHRDVPTVYPTAALGLFSIAAAVPRPILGFKLIVVLVDLAACVLLRRAAVALGAPARRATLYAWNPLVVLEGAGMGHVDVVGAATVAAVLVLLTGRRRSAGASARAVAAGAAAALGVLVKLVPLVALPAWWLRGPRRLLALLACVGVLAVGAAPVIGSVGAPPGLVVYGVSWEFNGPLFEPLWRALDGAGAVPTVKAVLEGAKQRLAEAGSSTALVDRAFPYVYPQFLAKLILLVLLAAVVCCSLVVREPVAATLVALTGLVMCSATVYPWYLVWVLAPAALLGAWPYVVLSLSAVLSYLPSLVGADLFPWVYIAVWLPFMSAMAVWALGPGHRRGGSST